MIAFMTPPRPTPPRPGSRRSIVIAITWAIAMIGAGPCRENPVAPVVSETPEPAPSEPDSAPVAGSARPLGDAVPQLRQLSIDQVGTDLHVRFELEHRKSGAAAYDPIRPGGWSFQMFLDSDQSPTGYWNGYDFITRDTEPDLARHSIRVRRTIALGDPSADGWGEETAVVPLHVNGSTMTFRVPLAALADHDGRIDFALEVYRTAPCAECPTGRSYEFAYSLFGSSDPHGRSLVVRGGRGGRGGHFARSGMIAQR